MSPRPALPGWEVPQQHYLIQPRHLAGGGDLTHITAYLHAAGWKNRTRRSGGRITFDSPDGNSRVSYARDLNPPRWMVSGNSGNDPANTWHASFGAAIPVEILAGFTDALTRSPTPQAPNVWRPLTGQGWTNTAGEHPTATSPDGGTSLQFRQENGSAAWMASANATTSSGQETQVWDAVLTDNAPMRAIEGFAAALADPMPLLRPPGSMPFTAARQATATPYMVLPSQLGAWQRLRVTAARATRRARTTWGIHRPRRPTRAPRPARAPKPAGIPRPLALTGGVRRR
ncbi:DUF317 domain-containing protein [Streptomyces bathyalis]|uniref:DUF317 domain-containing protein n=1 Tax=Streptomyces bathyalis TaxID=2710756 RepID=A0A7T1T2H4_9ACTN|nr:DUF317 domain-containing protein [Streptomyces bathyalis]QPP05189.1 DUF317 domain-containing protein [Streptomyces bathyalis]